MDGGEGGHFCFNYGQNDMVFTIWARVTISAHYIQLQLYTTCESIMAFGTSIHMYVSASVPPSTVNGDCVYEYGLPGWPSGLIVYGSLC